MSTNVLIKPAGNIHLTGKVIVSDPCYGRDVWCIAKDIAVRPGKYATYIAQKDERDSGIRVAYIMAVHTDFAKQLKTEWESYDGVIGVDSGQCGIFDDTVFPADKQSGGEYDDENSFYGECCKLTLSEAQGGILKTCNGFVSSSGYGDGSYELLCQYHEGERVALMVDFGLVRNGVMTRALPNIQ